MGWRDPFLPDAGGGCEGPPSRPLAPRRHLRSGDLMEISPCLFPDSWIFRRRALPGKESSWGGGARRRRGRGQTPPPPLISLHCLICEFTGFFLLNSGFFVFFTSRVGFKWASISFFFFDQGNGPIKIKPKWDAGPSRTPTKEGKQSR